MTQVTAANITLHKSGDQIKVVANISNVQNAYTWTVPHMRVIEDVCITCTTDDTISCTKSGNVLTFADDATLAASIAVYGR